MGRYYVPAAYLEIKQLPRKYKMRTRRAAKRFYTKPIPVVFFYNLLTNVPDDFFSRKKDHLDSLVTKIMTVPKDIM